MRLVTSSTSLAASQALIRSSSNSAIASDVDHAYNLEVKQSETRNSLSIECSFVVSSSLRGDNIDAGILKCSDPNYICVEDVNSSLGGRCVAAIAAKQRMLQNTPNPCTRCYGGGCDGLSDEFITNNVGEGSCCGAYACVGATNNTIIGPGSCVGYFACFGINATIGAGSCVGDSTPGYYEYYGFSCQYLKGTVGDNSCYEYASCNQPAASGTDSVVIGDYSCLYNDACAFIAATSGFTMIGDNSCSYYYACYRNSGHVSDDSCQSAAACVSNSGMIGKNSCNEELACYLNSGDVSDGSCQFPRACFNNTGSIEQNSCNNIGACENNHGHIGRNQCNGYPEICIDNIAPITSPPTNAPSPSVSVPGSGGPTPTAKSAKRSKSAKKTKR